MAKTEQQAVLDPSAFLEDAATTKPTEGAVVQRFAEIPAGKSLRGNFAGFDAVDVRNMNKTRPEDPDFTSVEVLILERDGIYMRILMREGIYSGIGGVSIGDSVTVIHGAGGSKKTRQGRNVDPWEAFFTPAVATSRPAFSARSRRAPALPARGGTSGAIKADFDVEADGSVTPAAK